MSSNTMFFNVQLLLIWSSEIVDLNKFEKKKLKNVLKILFYNAL